MYAVCAAEAVDEDLVLEHAYEWITEHCDDADIESPIPDADKNPLNPFLRLPTVTTLAIPINQF